MRITAMIHAVALAGLLSLSAGAQEKFEPTWESLDSRPCPPWFDEAKFGIFIHWGVYAVPAWSPKGTYSEWYWDAMQNRNGPTWKFHEKTYGAAFKYQDFAPMFKAELYDPAVWADVFARSGAKYVVLTSKHHDGFCLWPSRESWNWNSADVGPHRDLLGDLTNAVRARGMKMGIYYSLYEWFNPVYRQDVNRYVNEHMLPQIKDVVTRYKPSVIFSDGEWDHPWQTWRSPEFLAWLFNESPCREDVVVNDRWGKECRSRHGGYFTTEYGEVGGGKELFAGRKWEENRGIGASFGYNRNEELGEYRTAEELIHLLVSIVSKGGNLLLDVGPTSDGRIPVIMQQRLIEMGEWLNVNGEAIYGTKRWRAISEASDSVITRLDPRVDFDWKKDSPQPPIPADNFTAAWTGFVEPEFSETYKFHTVSDDGTRLWVDGKKIIDNWTDHVAAEDAGEIKLEAGKRYPIKLEYYEKSGDSVMKLLWSSKSLPKQVIPAERLSLGAEAASGHGLKGDYSGSSHWVFYTSKGDAVYAICLKWPGRELKLRTPKPGEGAAATMLGVPGALKWRTDGEGIAIETPALDPGSAPCRHAWVFKLTGVK